MRVNILRQQSPKSEPYWETFEYDGPMDNSVAGVLDYINYHDDVVHADGKPSTRVGWECSCMQGVCGACSMVINGTPALACETFIRGLKAVELRPLRKFPVIHDLVVDRTVIQENLKRTGDAFRAGFIYRLFHDCPVEQCVQFGNITGAACVSAPGCLTGYGDEARLLAERERGYG